MNKLTGYVEVVSQLRIYLISYLIMWILGSCGWFKKTKYETRAWELRHRMGVN